MAGELLPSVHPDRSAGTQSAFGQRCTTEKLEHAPPLLAASWPGVSEGTGSRGLQRRTLRDNRGLASLVLRDLEGLVLPALGRLAEGASRLRGVHLVVGTSQESRPRAFSVTGGPVPGYHERGNYTGTRFASSLAMG
jgi:hypothetical protein